MIEKENNIIDNKKEYRRRGGAFDTLSNVLRNVKELLFNNGVIIRNRKSEIADSNSVLEMFATKDPKQSENYIYIGRGGVNNPDTRNVNYIELTVDADTTKPSRVSNGQIGFRMSLDRVAQDSSGIYLGYGGVFGDFDGIRAILAGQGDGGANDIGGAQITYSVNGVLTYAIAVDKDGIQMVGLPTSASGLSTGAIWNDGGTLKIVS